MSDWVKYSLRLAVAMGQHGPVDRRLIEIAITRVNAIGHAEFGPGELVNKLAVVDPVTGEILRTVDQSTVRRAIIALKSWGVIDKDSTSRCLHFDPGWLSNGTGSRWCEYHATGQKPSRRRHRRRRVSVHHTHGLATKA